MISIVLGTNEKWPSRLIRWATQSPWSHVWIEYKSMTWGGQWMVVHSASKGVMVEPQERVHARYPKRKVYECEVGLTEGLLAIRSHLGADYDYRAVIWNGFLLAVYTAVRLECLRRIVHKNAAKLSCSELVATALKAARIEGSDGLDPELTTPGMVDEFCASTDCFWVA